MIIDNVKEATVISNLSDEDEVEMSFDEEGILHLMDTLTNLYKDPELAVIREYYTNALDAHAAAGIDKPVKVTLPSWDDPSYKVQDFGIGMSKDDIKRIYSKYGASTKRKSANELGAFGLGCKSALTLCTQFTLVSIKDGFKSTALISKSESGANKVNVVTSVPTDEPNGTTVQIPIKDKLWNFVDKANRFFSFSKPGLVEVDGRTPDYAFDSSQKVENPDDPEMQIYLKPKTEGESYVLMGPVPYAISQAEIEASLSRLGIKASRGFIRMPKYFIVPIGAVHLTAPREGLRFTDKTNGVIDAHISFLVNDLKAIAKEKIDAVESLEEFFDVFAHWNSIVSIPHSYKDETVPTRLILNSEVRTISRYSYGSSSHGNSNQIILNTKYHCYVIKHDAAAYKKINQYLTPYLKSIGEEDGDFIITDDPDLFNDPWFNFSKRFTVLTSEEVIEKGKEQRKKDRAEAAASGTSKPKKVIRYPVVFINENKIRWVDHTDIPEKTPYIHYNDYYGNIQYLIRAVFRDVNGTRSISPDTIKSFKAVTNENQIILLNGTRTVKALEQRVTGTYSLATTINNKVADLSKFITPEVIRHQTVTNSAWRRFLDNSGVSRLINEVKDPNIVSILTPVQSVIDSYEAFTELDSALHYFSPSRMPARPRIDNSVDEKFIRELDTKYVLVNSLRSFDVQNVGGAEHVVKYFNMIHEETSVQS